MLPNSADGAFEPLFFRLLVTVELHIYLSIRNISHFSSSGYHPVVKSVRFLSMFLDMALTLWFLSDLKFYVKKEIGFGIYRVPCCITFTIMINWLMHLSMITIDSLGVI